MTESSYATILFSYVLQLNTFFFIYKNISYILLNWFTYMKLILDDNNDKYSAVKIQNNKNKYTYYIRAYFWNFILKYIINNKSRKIISYLKNS